jgi:hypothetical protein
MKFTIITTLFAPLAATGVSAAADTIPVVATVDETAPQGNMNDENHRALRATHSCYCE